MTANRARAIAAVFQASIAFLLVTQSDVALAPVAKVILGVISVALAAVDWGAILEPNTTSTTVKVTTTNPPDETAG